MLVMRGLERWMWPARAAAVAVLLIWTWYWLSIRDADGLRLAWTDIAMVGLWFATFNFLRARDNYRHVRTVDLGEDRELVTLILLVTHAGLATALAANVFAGISALSIPQPATQVQAAINVGRVLTLVGLIAGNVVLTLMSVVINLLEARLEGLMHRARNAEGVARGNEYIRGRLEGREDQLRGGRD